MRYQDDEIYDSMFKGKQRKARDIRIIDDLTEDDDVYIHIVDTSNENLMHLAEMYYSDFKQWYRIADKNPSITNPFNIKVNTKIVIPF